MTFESHKRQSHLALETLQEVNRSRPYPCFKTQAGKKTSFWERSTPKNDAGKPFKRKRVSSPENQGFNSRAVPLELHLSKAVKAGVRAHEYVKIQHESPWKSFQKVYELKFDDVTIVAIRKASPCEVVTVKGFTEPNCHEKLDMLQQIRHENFVVFLESFRFQECSYAVLQHVPISLVQIVASPPYPTELQLAAILGQILHGLAYLTSKGLVHESLACSNVLLSAKGVVKIANQEHCIEVGPSKDGGRDVRAVGHIAMELMQKFSRDDGTIGVEDLNRWPSSSHAVGFLSETTSANCVTELIQHPLIESPWRVEELKWMVELAGVSVHRSYKYLH